MDFWTSPEWYMLQLMPLLCGICALMGLITGLLLRWYYTHKNKVKMSLK